MTPFDVERELEMAISGVVPTSEQYADTLRYCLEIQTEMKVLERAIELIIARYTDLPWSKWDEESERFKKSAREPLALMKSRRGKKGGMLDNVYRYRCPTCSELLKPPDDPRVIDGWVPEELRIVPRPNDVFDCPKCHKMCGTVRLVEESGVVRKGKGE